MDPLCMEILLEFKKLLEKSVDIHKLILFGSRARGNFEPDSDMDVLVVVKKLDPKVERAVSDCAWQMSLERGVLIVPVVYSQDEWENGPERYSLLAMAVKREGIAA